MPDIPPTRASLLVRLRDGKDDGAWREFVQLYAPVVYRFARRKGLQDADAADLTQEVLRGVSTSVGSFDPQRGLFRSWLFTLAHRRLYDFVQGNPRQQMNGKGTVQLLDEVPAPDEEDSFNQEVERQLFKLAADHVRPALAEATWQAFHRTAVEGASGQEVAKSLGISVAAVYLAKSRVMVKLKAEIARLQKE